MIKKRFLSMLVLLMTAVTGAWAQSYEAPATENETIIFNDLGLSNAYDLTTDPLTVGNIELNFDKADGSNPPAFYTSGGGTARLYKGNTMSVDAGGATITKIVFTYASDVTPAFSTGSYTSSTKTWEGEATTLTVTNAYTTNTQIRIMSMDVYYSVASAAGEAAYTVTLKEGTEDATNWTIDPAEARTTGVAQGTEITATYSGTKLVKSVKAKKAAPANVPVESLTIAKGSTGLSGDKVLYYLPGDTYRQALARTENQSTGGLGWGYWEDSNLTTIYFKEVSNKAWDVAIDGDSNFGSGKGSCTITLDTEINPTGHTFQFVGAQ